ncbi:hypothetical protein B0H63DRAFT_447862 [Podospora didyma]|uniref:WW domain-containing protein n=1 Tax=Podospora didyma TaxID=330526 RepID=A0AAE0NSS0_9PEZI|nr:hypothetical protein B0H63DRAFT_447862 [Podospora didyma]
MADFEAPSGPPPPKVPEGWIARWNDQYKEWFYVNKYTKKSQWDKPTEPARNPEDEGPSGPPPSYAPGNTPALTDSKVNPYDDNNNRGSTNPFNNDIESEDAKLARQLQAEEDARARGHSSYGAPGGGAAASYANTPPAANSPFPNQLPPRGNSEADKAKGLLGKLFGGKKSSGSGSSGIGGMLGGLSGGSHGGHNQQYGGGYGHQQPGYGQQPAYGQQPGYGGYGGAPGYGGYPPQQGYGNYPPQQGGYYPQQQHGGGGFFGGGGGHGYQQPPRKGGGGMGMAGGAALGLGAGVLGGVLVADAIQDGQQEAYQEGYQDGDDGGDYGGGDDGGGDF